MKSIMMLNKLLTPRLTEAVKYKSRVKEVLKQLGLKPGAEEGEIDGVACGVKQGNTWIRAEDNVELVTFSPGGPYSYERDSKWQKSGAAKVKAVLGGVAGCTVQAQYVSHHYGDNLVLVIPMTKIDQAPSDKGPMSTDEVAEVTKSIESILSAIKVPFLNYGQSGVKARLLSNGTIQAIRYGEQYGVLTTPGRLGTVTSAGGDRTDTYRDPDTTTDVKVGRSVSIECSTKTRIVKVERGLSLQNNDDSKVLYEGLWLAAAVEKAVVQAVKDLANVRGVKFEESSGE